MMDDALSGVAVHLQFDRPPAVHMISTTRSFTQSLYSPLVGAGPAARIGLVVHELMENLAKYSAEGPVGLDVDFSLRNTQCEIRITATNCVKQPQRSQLEALLQELAESKDPRETYKAFMHRSVARKVGSGLGLARIRAEGGMSIRWEVSDDTIAIRAEALIPTEG